MCILGVYVHIYTEYEVSMSIPVLRRATTHNSQSTIGKGSLVDKPNESKSVNLVFIISLLSVYCDQLPGKQAASKEDIVLLLFECDS